MKILIVKFIFLVQKQISEKRFKKNPSVLKYSLNGSFSISTTSFPSIQKMGNSDWNCPFTVLMYVLSIW